jgi:hypothetical protein
MMWVEMSGRDHQQVGFQMAEVVQGEARMSFLGEWKGHWAGRGVDVGTRWTARVHWLNRRLRVAERLD